LATVRETRLRVKDVIDEAARHLAAATVGLETRALVSRGPVLGRQRAGYLLDQIPERIVDEDLRPGLPGRSTVVSVGPVGGHASG